MHNGFVVLSAADNFERLFAPEVGRLHAEGPRLYDEQGKLFQWRGYSWFLGFYRFCNGENIIPDLEWFLKMGINMVRIFGPLPWVELDNRYTYGTFDFQKMDTFLSLLALYGIRVNWSVAPGEPSILLKQYANYFYEVASGHWNIVTELVNEPDHGVKPDPIKDFTGVNRRGILTAYGYYPEDKGRTWAETPVLDFGTIHTPRDSGWARKARHAQEWQKFCGKPVIGDEPAKIAEPNFSGAGVKNDWDTTPAEAGWHFGVLHLWTPGGTVHTQHGRNGLVPEPGSLTHTTVEAVRDNVWLKMPANVQFGGYMGSHFGTSPVDGDETPSGGPVWTYSSVHEHEAWSVRCYPTAPNAKNGWRIVDRWGPYGEFVRLER